MALLREETYMKTCPWCDMPFTSGKVSEAVGHFKSLHPRELKELLVAVAEYEALDPEPIDMEEGLHENEHLDESNPLGWFMGGVD
jgi:hypothetical protein